jgi:hypothetical protein
MGLSCPSTYLLVASFSRKDCAVSDVLTICALCRIVTGEWLEFGMAVVPLEASAEAYFLISYHM